MTHRKLIEQLLEALTSLGPMGINNQVIEACYAAREYLAQPEQLEPVGEAEPYRGRSADHTQAIFNRNVVPAGTKLYTAPPHTELSDEEIKALWEKNLDATRAQVYLPVVRFARAVLAAARSKT